jgi:hypothetical protein
VVHVVTTVGSGKRQARPPMDYFEKLLEKTCLNHAYLVKHKLRDCGMMTNFMASGSITRGMEVNEVPNEGNTTPFLGEDAVMVIYNGCPSARVHRMFNLSLGTPACYDWGRSRVAGM